MELAVRGKPDFAFGTMDNWKRILESRLALLHTASFTSFAALLDSAVERKMIDS
jgi:hypothetical protein